MLNSIIRFSIRNKLLVGLFILGWTVWGALELTRLPIDALPDITSNQVQVITVTPTLASPEVERLITFPIEQACSNIPGITEIRSISRFGLSVVTIVFGDETDIYWARQQVSERLLVVRDEIPRDAGIPELAPVTTGLGEIYQYVVKPAKGYEGRYSLSDLRTIQDWIVRRQLIGISGVADVSSFGGHLKQYEVAIRPDRLKGMGLTVTDVFNALEGNNQNSGGAYIEKGPSLLFIRTEGLVGDLDQIRRIPVRRTADGMPVLIGDIAEVRIGSAVRYGAMTFEDEGEVAGAVVLMLKGENASMVINRIRERMEQIRKTLPEGIELVTFLDRTKMVDRAIRTVKTNLLEGALIVVLVLVFFLGNLRAGLIVASVIPLSMLFAVAMMNLTGVSGNLMSLGALDFGLIVDGAVIIVEAVLHRLHHHRPHAESLRLRQGQMDEAVGQSAGRMMNAAVFGQIIILIVYLPILTLVGIEGKMFRPMAQTVAFALIGAFILSLTYVPMVTSLAMSKKLPQRQNLSDRLMGYLTTRYQSLLRRVLPFPRTVAAVALCLFLISLLVATRLGGEFIPELEEGDFAVDARILTGSSLNESIRVTTEASRILKGFPEVERVVTRIGASEIPTDPMPIEMTDIIISLKDKSQWTSADSYDALADTMSAALSQIPGMTYGFQYPVQMRFNELIAGARQDVVCKIFGEDLDTLALQAQMLAGIVSGIDGAKDLYVEAITGLPQIVIRYRREQMAMYGVGISEVNRLVRAAFAGEVAGKVYENERRFDLVVRLSDRMRTDVDDVRQLLVPTPSGIQVPLYQLANVRVEEGPNQIQREDAKRRIIVAFNTRGRDVQSIVEELQRKVNAKLQLPSGYYIRYGGQFENLVEAKQRLMVAVPVALLLIFLLLYFAFGSIRYGLLIFSAIPLSAIGGIFSLWLRDMPFSISAGIGFIALFGVAVLNGIVLIAEFNRLRKESGREIGEAILRGAEARLRPVLMTAAVASLGFLPMALSQSAGAEVQRPLATVVIGGLVSATLLTLLLLPVLYQWFERTSVQRVTKPGTMTMVAILCFSCLQAQDFSGVRVPLDTLLSRLPDRSLSMRAVRESDRYWRALGERTFELPKAQLGMELGNINSMNTDTRFYLSQSFLLPAVYNRNRDYYAAGLETNRLHAGVVLNDLRREVSLVYANMIGLMERDALLDALDSIFSRTAMAAELRLRTGESTRLEKASADAQLEQIRLQRRQLSSDLRISQERLATLLDSDEHWLPVMSTLFTGPPTGTHQNAQASHPLLQYLRSKEGMLKAETAIERSRLDPEFTIGYSNLSLVGWQSKDGQTQSYFGPGQRFNILQFTMSLPLFNAATRSRLKAGAAASEALRLETMTRSRELEGRLKEAIQLREKSRQALEYHESTGIPLAVRIEEDAGKGLRAGDISYLEWSVLINQAIQIRMSRLEALQTHRNAEIEIRHLTSNQEP